MNNDPNKSDRPKLLKALISLRFFAAVMIVIHHSKGSFGLHAPWLLELPTGQGVSFFFVLSGFVLTYVYKSLDKPGTTGKFFMARLGRIWPLHLATLLLVFFLFPEPLRTPGGKDVPSIVLANIFLIQGWIPVWKYYFSYNWLSWAVSTEFAFYLLFPFLLRRWESTWHIKLFATMLLALGTIFCVSFFQIPIGDTSGNTGKVGYIGLIYIGPLGRLFEFTLGMTVATVYRRMFSSYASGKAAGTLLEIVALGMAVGIICLTPQICRIINQQYPWVGTGGIHWLANGGLPCAFFGFLILVMAMEKGLLSTRLLSGRILTKLGDMSLAIYLLHQILVRYYQWRLEETLMLPDWLAYAYYWAFLLLGSYLLMEGIEKPCRMVISKLGRTHGSTPGSHEYGFSRRILPEIVKNKNAIIALMLLLALLLPVIAYLNSSVIPKNAIQQAEAAIIESNTNPEYRNISFGNKFVLKGAILVKAPNKVTLKLVWKSIRDQRLRFVVAVHVLDRNGVILSQVDYAQNKKKILVKDGALWEEQTDIEENRLHHATALGIVIYSPDSLSSLPINAGPRDWQEKRLLIHLPQNGIGEPSMESRSDPQKTLSDSD